MAFLSCPPSRFYVLSLLLVAKVGSQYVAGPGDLTCVGNGIYGTTAPPADLGLVYQVSMFHHACAITADKRVRCWGTRASDAAVATSPELPRGTVPDDLQDVKKVEVGAVHTCALTGGQKLACWMGVPGTHVQDFGQAALPDAVGSSFVIDFDTGLYHTCAIRQVSCGAPEGQLECWGDTTKNQVPSDLGPVKAVACGMDWSVVLEASGILRCFGANAPTPPSGVFQSVSLSLSTETACAMGIDGSVQCFKGALESGNSAPANGCVRSRNQAVVCSGVDVPSQFASPQDYAVGMQEWAKTHGKFIHGTGTQYSTSVFYLHEAQLRCMQEPTCTGLACSANRLTHCDLRTGNPNSLINSGSGSSTYKKPTVVTQVACFVGGGSGEVMLGTTESLTTTITCSSTTTSTTSSSNTTTTTASSSTLTTSSSSTYSTSSSTSSTSSTTATTVSTTSTSSSTTTLTTSVSSTSSSSTSSTSTSASSTSSTSSSSSTSTASSTSTSSSSTSSTSTSTVSTSSTSSSSSTSLTSTTSTSSSSSTSTTTSTVSTTSTSSSSSTSSTSSTSSSSSSTSSTSTSSSSSSTSSTSTSTVTTSSSSSSTTSHTAPFLSGASELVDFFAKLEAAELNKLWNSSEGSTKVERADVTLQVTKLKADGKEAVVKVEGVDAGVTVPSSFLSSFDGPVAAVISVFKGDDFLSRLQGVDSSGYETKLQSVMKMEIHSPEGRQRVSGLAEPLLLQMPPVNKSSAVVCSYWDEASGRWAYDGLTTTWDGDSLVCAATHLTLFAAILRGILTALACSQLTLFNSKAVQTLFNGKWLGSPVGAAFILLMLFFFSLMSAACYVDTRRKLWSDEMFLIPRGPAPVEDEAENTPEFSAQTSTSSRAGRCLSCLAACKEHTSMAAKEACMEIMSSFFESVGALSDIIGSCGEACRHHKDLKSVVQHATAHLTLNSLRMQLGATSGFSDEAVEFAMGDEELLQLFAEATEKAEREGGHPCKSVQAWYDLHQTIAESLEHTWGKVGTCRRFPIAIGRLFLLMNPFFSLYTINPFWSSALRLLILMCELSGSLLLGVFLFQNTAGAMDADSPDDCEANGFWEQLGQMIVIGTASALLAALPAALLSALHHRKLVKVAYEECEEWKRQLRVWRKKDMVLWFFGVLYVAFCLFVVALFLANMHPNDQPEWGVSGLTSLAEDALLVPIAMALIVPLLAMGAVALLSCITGTHRAAVLQAQREALEQEGTWMHLPSVGRETRSKLVNV